MTSSLVAAFHYLALGTGLGSVFMRGVYLRQLKELPSKERFSQLFIADGIWGVSAVLWIVTGLFRVFGHLDKGSDYYLHHPMFWVKMSLFGLVWLLEIRPMVTLIQWRIQIKKGKSPQGFTRTPLTWLIRMNDLEVTLVFLIPFIASAMARGVGL
jgi:putative membrane protein